MILSPDLARNHRELLRVWRGSRAGFWVCLCLGLGSASVALAASRDTGWEPLFTETLTDTLPAWVALPAELAQAQEVAPARLSRLRGRFVRPEQIVYFGIDMSTQWQAGADKTHDVQLSLALDLRKLPETSANTPPPAVISLSLSGPSHPVEPVTDPDSGLPSSTLAATRGTVQSVQLQGDRNRVWNALDIEIRRGAPDALPAPVDPAPVSEDQSFQSDTGFTTRVEVSPGHFGYRILRPHQGEVVQMLSDQGLLQSIRLSSHDQLVANRLQLRIYQAETATAALDGVRNSLQLLRHLALPRPF